MSSLILTRNVSVSLIFLSISPLTSFRLEQMISLGYSNVPYFIPNIALILLGLYVRSSVATGHFSKPLPPHSEIDALFLNILLREKDGKHLFVVSECMTSRKQISDPFNWAVYRPFFWGNRSYALDSGSSSGSPFGARCLA